MTATATVASPACPVCGGAMYDNRGTPAAPKKNPRGPDFKCKAYKEGCEGVIWPPKGAPPKPAPRTALPQARSLGTPEFLPTEGEEQAELSKRIGFDIGAIQTELTRYHSIADWYIDTIVPILTKADVGCSPESVTAGIATIYINTSKK